MELPKQEELTRIINLAKDAADKSCFGPLFQYPDQTDITKRQVNQLAYGVFCYVLVGLLKTLPNARG